MKISIIIPVYNAEKYVSQAVESALRFAEVYEVILVEDKSPDDALRVCQQLSDTYEKVKLFQHPDKGNHGAGASRNLGIEKATGDFIAFLDADDYYCSNRFDAERELFKSEKVEGIYGAIGVHYYSEKAKEQYYKLFQDRLTTVYQQHPPQDLFAGLIGMKGSFGLFSLDGLTIRKSALHTIENLFKTRLRLHQDTEFLFRLAYYLKLYPGIIDKAVAMRGVHEDNRITQVDSGKIKPASTRVLLWEEVHNWAQNEASLDKNLKLHIERVYRSFVIANHPSRVKRWEMVIKYFFTDYTSIRSGLYNINFRKELF